MDDGRRRAILAELLAEHPAVPMQQPYQFTVKDYMEISHVSDAQARRLLDTLVREGVLKSCRGLGDYARKVTRSDPTLTTGMGLFEVVDGRLGEIKPLTQVWDLRECEEI